MNKLLSDDKNFLKTGNNHESRHKKCLPETDRHLSYD